MHSKVHRSFLDYSVAVLAVVVALYVRWLLNPLLDHHLPFSTLYGAVAVTVWFGGLRPALLAALLGYLGAVQIFVETEPGTSLSLHGAGGIAGLALYGGSCLIVIGFGNGMRAAQRRAEASAQEALAQQICLEKEAAERKQAEDALRDSEQRFVRFMHHLPGLAWIKDRLGRYLFANDGAQKAFQSSEADLYGKTDDQIFPPETAKQFMENDLRALASESGFQTIEALEHEDGIVHHSLVSKFPILDGDGKAAMVGGMAIDITDRIRVEEALKEADRRKDEFIATLAHELRNPLAPIRNALHIMQLAQDNRDAVAEARNIIHRQVDLMVRIVDDLLDLSRITRGKIELRKESIELTAAVDNALETCRPLLEASGHELTVDLPPEPVYLHADLTRLNQVLCNLLNNACKFTPRGGHIRLAASRANGQVLIRLQDNGIGIPADMLPRVFEMFAQADQRLERPEGGLGIGLTLARRLVEMHGGAIEAHSAGLGNGSTFVLRLPAFTRKPCESPLPHGRGANLPAHSKRRILIADDNSDSANSLGQMLTLLGHEVRTTYDGLAALEAATTFRPDVILLDIGMPKMDGYETAHRIREELRNQDVVLIALTGWGQVGDRQRSAESGFNLHLVKPVDPVELQELVVATKRQVGKISTVASAF